MQKSFRLMKQLSAGDETYDVFISTDTPDRIGDRMNPAGCKWFHWQEAGGPVLWLHDYWGMTTSAGVPIGKANRIEIQDNGILVNFGFLPGDAFADKVKNAWEWGCLRATSIGYDLPLGAIPPKQNEHGGRDWTDWELLEFSIVPVPMNPEALRVSKSLGFNDLFPARVKGCGFCTQENILILSKPVEDTGEYIRVRVRDPGDFVDDSLRTMDISAEQGIKAVIGKLKSDPQGSTVVQTYLFDKSKDWTVEKAQAWVDEHGKSWTSPETKEGRVLSSANRQLIQECVSALQALLDATAPATSEEGKGVVDSKTSVFKAILNPERGPSLTEALARIAGQEKLLRVLREELRAKKVM